MAHKTLVVGLGQIGMGYDLVLDDLHIYSHARAFDRHPAFDLVGGVDPDASRRMVFERTYGRPGFVSIESALSDRQVDVVAIAVPTELHAKALSEVLAKSAPKAVLCEKPLSYDLDEAQAMVAACAAKGVDLYVNYFRRSHPGAIEVKRRIDIGEIATPLKGVVWYSKGLRHNGSHFLNLLEYWLGPVQDMNLIRAGRLWDNKDPEPDLDIVFKDGSVTFLAAWEEHFSHYTVELLSPSGRLRYERGGSRIEWQPLMKDGNFSNYTVLQSQPEIIPSGIDRYQWDVAEALATALEDLPAQICTGQAALITLQNIARAGLNGKA